MENMQWQECGTRQKKEEEKEEPLYPTDQSERGGGSDSRHAQRVGIRHLRAGEGSVHA